MRSGYVHIANSRFHYRAADEGKRLLIAFHGYGNDARLFTPLVPCLENEFTVVSVDLPHHGATRWNGERIFSKEQLQALLLAIAKEFKVERFTLLGYSIGGRICLCAAELLPERVDQCVLLASDGLTFNPFYYFVTKNKIGGKLFRSFLSKEKNLQWVDRMLRYKLIDTAKHRFVMHYLKTADDRNKLQDRWNVLSRLVPDHRTLKKSLNEYAVPITIFMGEKDRVIPVAHARRFVKGISTADLRVLKKGHRLLDEETLPIIAQTLIKR